MGPKLLDKLERSFIKRACNNPYYKYATFYRFFEKYAILFIKKENIFQIRKKHVCETCRPGNKEISCSLYRGLNNPITRVYLRDIQAWQQGDKL